MGFIVGGGAILWTLDWLQWQSTFLMLAALVFLNTLPILYFKEPQQLKNRQTRAAPDIFKRHKIKAYVAYFYQTRHLALWLWVLISFKITDGLSGPLLKPLMVDLGLSFSQIGIYVTMFGALAALLGAALAGLSLKYMARAQALLIFSVLKVLSLAAYTWLAVQYQAQKTVAAGLIYLINAAEDFISAMLLVVMLTLVMQYSRQAHAGTDFTFQVAILATVSGALYSLSGVLADMLGYANYLTMITGLAVLLLWPILRWKNSLT